MADDIDAVLDEPVARVPLSLLIAERKKFKAEQERYARALEEHNRLQAEIMAMLDAEEKAARDRLAAAQARDREVQSRPTSAQNRVKEAIAKGLWPPPIPPSIAPRAMAPRTR